MDICEKKVIVTGGAGFIGSCMVRTLNDRGISNIIIVDNIGKTDKWKNLHNKTYCEYIHKNQFLQKLWNGELGSIHSIIHMGACSSTTEDDFDYLWTNNVEYTKALWKYCAIHNISFIYASSAATYGNGSEGFDDKKEINLLRPLNRYGYSKQIFDQWAVKQKTVPIQHVALKFFNVYGPNEYFKGNMASMVFHGFSQIKEKGVIRLFKSYNADYEDGGQLRDFVYVKDVCDVICHFIDHPQYSGIFNVGTGQTYSFKELAVATFQALGLKPQIEYFDMPETLKLNYQYYTKADISSLSDTGYHKKFLNLEQGVFDYVRNYLNKQYYIY